MLLAERVIEETRDMSAEAGLVEFLYNGKKSALACPKAAEILRVEWGDTPRTCNDKEDEPGSGFSWDWFIQRIVRKTPKELKNIVAMVPARVCFRNH